MRKTEKIGLSGNSSIETSIEKEDVVLNDLKTSPSSLYQMGGGTNIAKIECKYSVIMSMTVFKKLTLYSQLLNDEISGLGVIEFNEREGDFIIRDISCGEQLVSKGVCDLTPKGIIDSLKEFEAKGYRSEQVRCWWHSHNTMGISWSSQDEETSKKFAPDSPGSYLISIVLNHKEEIKAKLNVYNPFPFEIDDIPIYVDLNENEAIDLELLKREVKEKVKKEKFHTNITTIHGTEKKSVVTIGGIGIGTIKKDNSDAPWMTEFQISNLSYSWNKKEKKYIITDKNTNRIIVDEEAEILVGVDFNKNLMKSYNWFARKCYPEFCDIGVALDEHNTIQECN